MKTCPQCGTSYEEHVLTCLLDGQDMTLVGADAPAESAAPVVAAPPTPPAPSQQATIAVAAERQPTSKMPVAALAFAFAFMALALVVIGVGAIVLIGSGPTPPPEPVPVPTKVEPTPKRQPAPTPTPPAPDPVLDVQFVTQPERVDVVESGVRICSTPCNVTHPPHAPIPRMFTLEKEGYVTLSYEMTDPSVTQTAELQPIPRKATPRPAKNPKPTPKPGKRVPRLGLER